MGPDNAGYFHAAYVLAAVVYVGYAGLLVRRRARVRRLLRELAPDRGAPGRGPLGRGDGRG